MTLPLQALVWLVLLVCGAVAYPPLALIQPSPALSPPLRPGLGSPGLWLVESPAGQWYLNGKRLSRSDIKRLLAGPGKDQLIHYLPSDALPLERVSRSLRWLRSRSPGAVVLELPAERLPSP